MSHPAVRASRLSLPPKLPCGAPAGCCDFGQAPGAAPAALRFDALANCIDQLVWSMSPEGAHDYFNDRWYEFTGLSELRYGDESWRACVHADDIEPVRQAWSASLQSGEPYQAEFRLRHHSGEYRWVISRARPARDEAGAILRWYGTCTDIHDLKVAQEELAAREAQSREWNERLEQRVAERTAELVDVQAALRQSQKLDAMGQITGGVAHDFNNLLTPIIGGLEIVQRCGFGAGDQRLQRVLSGALASAERARTLVQRLLAFARRQPLVPAPVNLSELMCDMRQILATTVSPRVELAIDMPASLPYVNADQNQLEIALLNLAVNARDAMPDGGRVRIRGEIVCVRAGDYAQVAPGYYVRVSVVDSGCGMTQDVRARAIEPFFTTKAIGQGTGLGLSMAHGLVAQLGGVLTIDSAPGQGCTVSMLLPTANSPFLNAPEHVDACAVVASGRVLLADDEEDVRASVAQMLAFFGLDVVEAASAEQALAMLDRGETFELVITDHLMRGMSGVDLARHIRTLWPEQKMLIVTGVSDIEHVAPEFPRLRKPFRHADLARILPALLERNKVRAV